jgi:anti-sigma regulatory factor (Ser/Thr protein kinase)
LVSQLQAFAQERKLPPAVLQAADLALEEHLTNVLSYSYAYEDKRSHQILVRLEIVDGTLLVEVQDDGRPFNPLNRPEVDTSLPLDKKPIGGLGVFLIRHVMDHVEYQREGDKNIFRMRKRL